MRLAERFGVELNNGQEGVYAEGSDEAYWRGMLQRMGLEVEAEWYASQSWLRLTATMSLVTEQHPEVVEIISETRDAVEALERSFNDAFERAFHEEEEEEEEAEDEATGGGIDGKWVPLMVAIKETGDSFAFPELMPTGPHWARDLFINQDKIFEAELTCDSHWAVELDRLVSHLRTLSSNLKEDLKKWLHEKWNAGQDGRGLKNLLVINAILDHRAKGVSLVSVSAALRVRVAYCWRLFREEYAIEVLKSIYHSKIVSNNAAGTRARVRGTDNEVIAALDGIRNIQTQGFEELWGVAKGSHDVGAEELERAAGSIKAESEVVKELKKAAEKVSVVLSIAKVSSNTALEASSNRRREREIRDREMKAEKARILKIRRDAALRIQARARGNTGRRKAGMKREIHEDRTKLTLTETLR